MNPKYDFNRAIVSFLIVYAIALAWGFLGLWFIQQFPAIGWWFMCVNAGVIANTFRVMLK